MATHLKFGLKKIQSYPSSRAKVLPSQVHLHKKFSVADLRHPTRLSNVKLPALQTETVSDSSRRNSVVSSDKPRLVSRLQTQQMAKRVQWPMPGVRALELFSSALSGFEKEEITDYSAVYYLGQKCWQHRDQSQANNGCDDANANYLFFKGDHIAYRYSVEELLGAGTFGTVCKAFDHKDRRAVAIKVIRNNPRFAEQAQVEVDLLRRLRDFDQAGKQHIITLCDSFTFRGHCCLVFELMDASLFDVLRENKFVGFDTDCVRKVARQVLESLAYLKRHGIIHCDLKPENILFQDRKDNHVKLIDFGSACLKDRRMYSYIQSRFYRAPEVVLGCSYGTPIDMWSFGCLLFELATGQPLFPSKREGELLKLMVGRLGSPSREALQGRKVPQFFDKELRVRGGVDDSIQSLEAMLSQVDPQLGALVKNCLQWKPEDRPTPQDALRHEFFCV